MIAAARPTDEYPLVPAQRTTSPSIKDALIAALEAFVGAEHDQGVRDTLRDALQRYIYAEQVTG